MPKQAKDPTKKTVSTLVDIDTYYDLKIAALQARCEQQEFYRRILVAAINSPEFLSSLMPA